MKNITTMTGEELLMGRILGTLSADAVDKELNRRAIQRIIAAVAA